MKKGIYLVLATAVISGFANFFNKFAMNASGKNAFQYTTLKNVIVALILSLIILLPMVLPKLKKLNKKDWGKLGLIGLFGGSIPFLLFFKGLSMTSAVNASFIHKTLFIWVAILAWPVLKEKLSKFQFLALGVLFLGNIIFIGFQGMTFGVAEAMILLATIFWAVENVIAKVFLDKIEPIVLGWGRMFFGSILLVSFLFATGNISGIMSINLQQSAWLALASLFLTGYVFSWYSALKYLPVTVTTSILVIASPITTFLNTAFVTHQLPSQKVLGAFIILIGTIMIVTLNLSQGLIKRDAETS